MGPSLGFNSNNIVLGAGDILYRTRGASDVTVTPTATTTPTTTLFSVSDTDAAKLRVGDVLQAAATSPAYTSDEASTMPRILSITSNGTDHDVKVSPAFGVAPATGSATVKVLYKMLGATDGGIKVTFTPKTNPQNIDQSPLPVSDPVQDIAVAITAPLAEQLLEHLALALRLPAPTDGTKLSMSSAPDLSREDRILTVTPAPNGTSRFGVFHRCTNSGAATIEASKTQKGIFNLSLNVLPDTSMDPAGVFDFQDA